MRKLTAIALFALPGCATIEEWQDERHMNQTVVAEVAPGQYRTVTYRELAELNAQKAREDEARRKQRAEQEEEEKEVRKAKQAELEKQDAAQREAARARIAADEARGYKHILFTDFILDHKTIPLGSKRAVSGLYQVFGELETLTAIPTDSLADNVPRVFLLTASAPREVRAKLLAFPCRPAFCPVVLLGRTTSCTIKWWFGNPVRNEVCLAIEEIW